MSTSLIEEVSEKISTEFKRLWPFQHEGEFVRSRELSRESLAQAEVSAAHQLLAEDQKVALAGLDGEEERREYLSRRVRAAVVVEKATERAKTTLDRQNERQAIGKEVGWNVSDQLNRLTPDTFPADDPETPRQMYDFLTAFSKSYAKEGKQSSAYMIVEYLLACDYDHWAWLWSRWIASCVAIGDRNSAESLVAAVTDGQTPAAHSFATKGGRFKPMLMATKAMIALRFDGDVEKAHRIACAAKDTFGDSREATQVYHALAYLKQEQDQGRLLIERKPDGRISVAMIDRVVPASALLTGKFGSEEEDS